MASAAAAGISALFPEVRARILDSGSDIGKKVQFPMSSVHSLGGPDL
jgi:hypothetical protein